MLRAQAGASLRTVQSVQNVQTVQVVKRRVLSDLKSEARQEEWIVGVGETGIMECWKDGRLELQLLSSPFSIPIFHYSKSTVLLFHYSITPSLQYSILQI
jgi:hypothetical protein